jgi:hypothetical protein
LLYRAKISMFNGTDLMLTGAVFAFEGSYILGGIGEGPKSATP